MPDFSARLPASLAARTRDLRLGARGVPALVVDPTPPAGAQGHDAPPPMLLWMHGRTVDRHLDPGRYLRLMRRGIGVCAIDLPGHGDRFDPEMQRPEAMPRILREAFEEIDDVLDEAITVGGFDPKRIAIGGMSAGGMIALARLADPERPCRFAAAAVECTTGSWRTLPWWPLASRVADLEPAARAASWPAIPLLALHNRFDEWVPLRSQEAFIEAIRPRYEPPVGDPDALEFVVFEKTGAPQEHAGFGRFAADAKERLVEFLADHLAPDRLPASTDRHSTAGE